MNNRKECAICGNDFLIRSWSLPALPLTGIFVKEQVEPKTYDQEFLFCDKCEHGQLANIIDPSELYNGSYDHRSSTSEISVNGNAALADFIRETTNDKHFHCALDVGANDGFLMSKLKANVVCGVDPSTTGKNIVNKFVEQLKEDDLPAKPNIVVSSHTFEHIPNIKEALQNLISLSVDDVVFFVEVPCLNAMLGNNRWDQVFHQHVNYFSKKSLVTLFKQFGFLVVNHRMNWNYWGGTQMWAFEKSSDTRSYAYAQVLRQNIQASIGAFNHAMIAARSAAEMRNTNLIGYGAAQMVPILEYHLKAIDELYYVADDNSQKHGLMWPGLKPKIQKPEKDLSDFTVMVTALDSSRAILKRCMELNARRMLLPVPII